MTQSRNNLRKRAEKALEIISQRVLANPIETLGLFDGFAGQSLFVTYIDMYENTEYERTVEYFNILQQKLVNQQGISPYISDGVAGVIWYFQHLYDIELLDDESTFELLLNNTEESIFTELKKGRIEFLYGAMGLAYSLLGTSKEKEVTSRLINILSKSLVSSDIGHYWISDPKQKSSKLAVSHGSLSILFFLLKAYDQNIEREKCKNLINGFISFILSKEFTSPDMSLFPYEVGEDMEEKDSRRVAWCYGDLMIGYGLVWAGKSLNNSTYTKKGIKVIDYIATRRDLEKTACNDPMFCHGAIGISHIFHRIFKYTGSELHKETQEYWLTVTLNYLESSDFKDIFYDFGTLTLTENHSFIEGTAGIGLGLITFLNPKLDAWDSCLLLS